MSVPRPVRPKHPLLLGATVAFVVTACAPWASAGSSPGALPRFAAVATAAALVLAVPSTGRTLNVAVAICWALAICIVILEGTGSVMAMASASVATLLAAAAAIPPSRAAQSVPATAPTDYVPDPYPPSSEDAW